MDPDPRAVLLLELTCEDPYLRADAARLLGELGDPAALEPLVAYVNTCRSYAKVSGFEALARLGDARAAAGIRHLVDHPNVHDDWFWYCCKSVRAAAAIALLALEDERGAGYLAELAEKQDDIFFAWFAPALLHLPETTRAARELKRRLTAEALLLPGPGQIRWSDPGRMTQAVAALGLLNAPAGNARLLELFTFRSRYVRGQAALALLAGAPADGARRARVAKMAREDPADFARVKAAQALCQAGDGEFAPALAAAAGALAEPFDRAAALEALGLARLTAYAPVAEAQLAHPDPYVRLCAIEALDRLDAGGAAVAARASDPDRRVRLHAAKYRAARKQAAPGQDAAVEAAR